MLYPILIAEDHFPRKNVLLHTQAKAGVVEENDTFLQLLGAVLRMLLETVS
jgi:hypothetical protein